MAKLYEIRCESCGKILGLLLYSSSHFLLEFIVGNYMSIYAFDVFLIKGWLVDKNKCFFFSGRKLDGVVRKMETHLLQCYSTGKLTEYKERLTDKMAEFVLSND